MTALLGIIAALLVFGLLALVLKSSAGQGDVLAFTSPEDLAVAQTAALVGTPATLRTASYGSGAAQSATSDFYPGNLGVGTRLTYRGETSEIVGVISFAFDGQVWQDYLATISGDRWWRLGVEPDRGMRLVAFLPTTSHVEPGPPHITYEGQSFTVSESGPATYRSVGQTGRFETGTYWFFDYRNDAGQVLNFERFDSGPWVVSLGRPTRASEVRIDNSVDQSSW